LLLDARAVEIEPDSAQVQRGSRRDVEIRSKSRSEVYSKFVCADVHHLHDEQIRSAWRRLKHDIANFRSFRLRLGRQRPAPAQGTRRNSKPADPVPCVPAIPLPSLSVRPLPMRSFAPPAVFCARRPAHARPRGESESACSARPAERRPALLPQINPRHGLLRSCAARGAPAPHNAAATPGPNRARLPGVLYLACSNIGDFMMRL
jgi:hypothetical protein